MTRTTKLAVTITDGPWKGRRILVRNPPPELVELPVQLRAGGTSTVTYRIDKGPHGLFGIRMVAPDQSLPSIGWRSWNLEALEGQIFLKSTNGEIWKPGAPLVAVCGGTAALTTPRVEGEPERHDAPAADCACGIYAARSLRWLRTHSYTLDVFGLVTLWGRSRQHEQGYRYERAYPLALIMNDDRIKAAGVGGGIFGVELGQGPEPVDRELVKTLSQMALVRDAYVVPVALGAPERGLAIIQRMREKGLLPSWSLPVLPTDVRFQISEGG